MQLCLARLLLRIVLQARAQASMLSLNRMHTRTIGIALNSMLLAWRFRFNGLATISEV